MKIKNFTSIIVVVLVMAAIVTANQVFGLGLGKKVASVLSPVGVVVSSTGQHVGSFFSNIVHIGSLQRQNNDLNSRLNASLAEIARLTEAKKENDSLRRDLEFKQTGILNLVPGYVAYFDPSLRDGITVRVDDMADIKVGNVVTAEGFLIGRVSRLDGNTVQVLLTTDSSSAVPATLQNKTITGIAKGKIGNGLTMEQVPGSDVVVEDDIVITSGLGGDIPKGLIIGRVDTVQKISGSIFQSVTLQPMLEFTKLERVMIAR